MAQISVWKVLFHLEAQAGSGRTSAGPYSAFIGVSGGTRGDAQTPSTVAAVKTAVTNNLLAILQAMGYAGAAAPGGTVVVEEHSHASVPDIFT